MKCTMCNKNYIYLGAKDASQFFCEECREKIKQDSMVYEKNKNKKSYKKLIFSFFILLTIILVVGGTIISINEKRKFNEIMILAKEDYIESLEELCQKYNLDDAEIIVKDFNKYDNYYVSTAKIKSEKFLRLSGKKAFSFAKEFYYLEGNYNYSHIDELLYSSCEIQTSNGAYQYDYTSKNMTELEYLLNYGTSEYTVKNGIEVYNWFNK